jgi:hypothetical protein
MAKKKEEPKAEKEQTFWVRNLETGAVSPCIDEAHYKRLVVKGDLYEDAEPETE